MLSFESNSFSPFSAFSLNPCVIKNAVEPITAENASIGFILIEYQTTIASNIETNKDKKDVQFIIDTVVKTGGVQYAETVMKKFIDNAYELLNEWPATEAKEVMKDLINYTIERKK